MRRNSITALWAPAATAEPVRAAPATEGTNRRRVIKLNVSGWSGGRHTLRERNGNKARSSRAPLWRLAIAAIALHAHAQTSPGELAQTVVARWCASSEKEFAAIYPFRKGRDAFAMAVRAQSRIPGLFNVIRTSAHSAVLLLSGVPRLPNSGDATSVGRGFSGVYEARYEAGRWSLASRIPLDEMSRILAHHMKAFIRPGSGFTVEDRMHIRVKGTNGFAARVNHAAKIEDIRSASRTPIYLFGGGLLWADLPEGETNLTIRYSIEVETDPNDTNSGCFLKNAGHLRSQYLWHPFFDFNTAADWADFDIEVRIPKEYRLSTSLAQIERVEGAERIVEDKTIHPASAPCAWIVKNYFQFIFGPRRALDALPGAGQRQAAPASAPFGVTPPRLVHFARQFA